MNRILAFAVRHFPSAAVVPLAASVAVAQIRVGLCAAASTVTTVCQWTDVQTRLQANPLFQTVDIIDVYSGTPTLSQLQTYDALLCWTNSTPADNVAWGNVLADYVDWGGGVVVAVFANSTTTAGRNIGGRWQTGYEVVLDQSGNVSSPGATLGTVHVPGHPVMAGVTAFQGGTFGARPLGTALGVGSTLIAEWSDGKVLVAQGANPRRIDLGFYPPYAGCSQSGWLVGGDLLTANALQYVASVGAYHPYGSGCAGSLGVPTLSAAGAARPVVGSTFAVTLGNLPLGVAIMVLGFSDTASGPFPLPLDLGPFGLPGCSLLAEVVASQLLFGAGTSATWSISLPNDPSYLGTRFVNQGFVLDPPANATGLTVTNAGKARIGV